MKRSMRILQILHSIQNTILHAEDKELFEYPTKPFRGIPGIPAARPYKVIPDIPVTHDIQPFQAILHASGESKFTH